MGVFLCSHLRFPRRERVVGRESKHLSKHPIAPVPVCSPVMGQSWWMSYRKTRGSRWVPCGVCPGGHRRVSEDSHRT